MCLNIDLLYKDNSLYRFKTINNLQLKSATDTLESKITLTQRTLEQKQLIIKLHWSIHI